MNTIHLESVDSTNTYARQHAKSFDPAKITCITADYQTAGRGRFQRHWISPKGENLLATFYFRLPSHSLHLISLAQVMAASIASVLLHEDLHPKIKWPNDVQLSGKKLAGVLCETTFSGGGIDVFLGAGINVNMSKEHLSKIDQPATSLFVETGRHWEIKALLQHLQRQFESDLSKFKKEGFAPFHHFFENLLSLKGHEVRCFDGKKVWVGICHSLTMDGQLNLYLPDKTIHTVSSGEVTTAE